MIDVGVSQMVQLFVQFAAEFNRHDLVLRTVNDVRRRIPKIFQERKQHVVDTARHRGDAGEHWGVVHPDQPGADASVRHPGQKNSIRIDVVPSLNGAYDGQHQILCTAREPGASRIGGADKDIAFAEARLPSFEIGVAGKSGSMEAHDQGIGFRRAIGRRNIQAVAVRPITKDDTLVG